ncbi:FAD-dependent oxidoreductase, partial [Candidatus Peregrinibacteria bacterium]|nr:FAD-dependent oxidoreductase [Candidatus Peregrinibacteria bacterium]
FIAIGHIPLSEVAESLGVKLNHHKEIEINRKSETNIPGIYAAGDVCDTAFKQAITGSAEAVTASYWAYEYIQNNQIVIE